MTRLLIVDDDRELLDQLTRGLGVEFGVLSSSGAEPWDALLARQPDAVLLDVRLRESVTDDRTGLDLLRSFRAARPRLPVIMMTAYGQVDMAVEAMKLGADDFVQKDAMDLLDLRKVIQNALERRRLEGRVELLEEDLRRIEPWDLVGTSRPLEEVRRVIEVAARDAVVTVLVEGPTGTGKELVARQIHGRSRRKDAAFVPVCIAVLNPGTVESELFGHIKGAFTGADTRKVGYLERAHGGTLFLDEIGDLDVSLQVKLLRFIEEREFCPVGGTDPIRLDIQLVVATNRDLEARAAEGAFRQDLFYRLNTLRIRLPSLAERREDIPALAGHFLGLFRAQGRTRARSFTEGALAALVEHDWPGNVRELRSAVERAVIFSQAQDRRAIEVEDLPGEVLSRSRRRVVTPRREDEPRLSLDEELARLELREIRIALSQCRGRKADAWQLLGFKHRHALSRRVRGALAKHPALRGEFDDLDQLFRPRRSGERL